MTSCIYFSMVYIYNRKKTVLVWNSIFKLVYILSYGYKIIRIGLRWLFFFFFWSDYIVNQEGWDSITCIVCVVYNNVYIVVQCASKNFFGGPKSCFVWFVCTQRTWLGTIGTYSIMSSCSYSTRKFRVKNEVELFTKWKHF